MSIASSVEFSGPKIPNVIPFPLDPDFGKGDFSEDKLDGKTKTGLLAEAYIYDRKNNSGRQKPIYFSRSEYSRFPESANGQFNIVFETTREFRKGNFSEETLGKLLTYLGDRTSKSVGGLMQKTIKTGIHVGISFNGENNYGSGRGNGGSGGGFFGREKNTGEECGIAIEVYNENQPIEIYRVDEQGRRYKAVLNPKKIKKGRTYNGNTFLNAYTLRCRASDLGNYRFSANVKSIRKIERKSAKVEKKPDKLLN